jgi:FkbH-like protein
LPRIAQLIQRSNQFNLTTQRRSQAECERLMHDTSMIPLYIELSDRLGDHGLISVVILQPDGEELRITDWLMSCRVLARGVEQYVMNEVFTIARERGLAAVTGRYIPTAKNGMVRDFFAQFGFVKVSEVNGETQWAMGSLSYRPSQVFIKPSENASPTLVR